VLLIEGDCTMAYLQEKNGMVQLVSSGTEGAPAAERQLRLTEMAHAIDTMHAFRIGQFVRWKPGLRNRGIPAYNEVAVVREVLADPVFDMCETARCAGSPYFGEPLTLVLGIIDPDGDFVELRYDGRRFEPLET
jgi:hypothetical protein